jgi:hypothetical protein
MKESYGEGVAIHSGPESCEGDRKVALEALDRGICSLGIELRNRASSGSRQCHAIGKATTRHALERVCRGPAESKTQACRETPCARTGRPHCRPPGIGGPEGERDER